MCYGCNFLETCSNLFQNNVDIFRKKKYCYVITSIIDPFTNNRVMHGLDIETLEDNDFVDLIINKEYQREEQNNCK